MKGLPAAVHATPVTQGAAVAAPPDISELLEEALEKYRREAEGGAQAEPAATGLDIHHSYIGALIAQALAASRQQGAVSARDVAVVAEEAVGERVEWGQPRDVDAGRTSAKRNMEQMQEGAVDKGAYSG